MSTSKMMNSFVSVLEKITWRRLFVNDMFFYIIMSFVMYHCFALREFSFIYLYNFSLHVPSVIDCFFVNFLFVRPLSLCVFVHLLWCSFYFIAFLCTFVHFFFSSFLFSLSFKFLQLFLYFLLCFSRIIAICDLFISLFDCTLPCELFLSLLAYTLIFS